MTDLRHPFRSPRLTGAQTGWVRPALVILVALGLTSLIGAAYLLIWTPTLAGPPKDGSGFTIGDHADMVFGALAASFVISWMVAPIALLALRLAAMTGWAGWGSAMLAAVAIGLPAIHVILLGDVTTENPAVLPSICVAIAVQGLAVWALFWGSVAIGRKRNRTRSG